MMMQKANINEQIKLLIAHKRMSWIMSKSSRIETI